LKNLDSYKRVNVLTARTNMGVYRTCSGLSPGGTHAYSSSAQPESSSEVELLWKPGVTLPILAAARGSISGPLGGGRSPLSPRSRFITHGRWRAKEEEEEEMFYVARNYNVK